MMTSISPVQTGAQGRCGSSVTLGVGPGVVAWLKPAMGR